MIFTEKEKKFLGIFVWTCKVPTDINEEHFLKTFETKEEIETFKRKLVEIKPSK